MQSEERVVEIMLGIPLVSGTYDSIVEESAHVILVVALLLKGTWLAKRCIPEPAPKRIRHP